MQFLDEVGEILAEYDRVAMATRAALVAQVQRAAVRVSEAVDADAKRQALAFEARLHAVHEASERENALRQQAAAACDVARLHAVEAERNAWATERACEHEAAQRTIAGLTDAAYALEQRIATLEKALNEARAAQGAAS